MNSEPELRQCLGRAALEVRDLHATLGGFKALDGVSLALPCGKIVGIIGPNGAGKSTLLNVLGGSVRQDSGDIFLAGRSISTESAHRRSRLGLIRSFQLARQLEGLTVLENVLVAAPAQPEGFWDALVRRDRVRRSEAAMIEKACLLLARINLWKHADSLAGNLSGGQKKLLELARALFAEPSVVLLDEPAAGVNPSLVGDIVRHIKDINQETGVTFGIVEHNMDMIAALSDMVFVLAAGRNLTHGSFAEVSSHRGVMDAYLGYAS